MCLILIYLEEWDFETCISLQACFLATRITSGWYIGILLINAKYIAIMFYCKHLISVVSEFGGLMKMTYWRKLILSFLIHHGSSKSSLHRRRKRGGGGAGGPPGPPIILEGGGANIPFGPPPNKPPAFSFNFYVKQEKFTNIPS